MNTPRADHEFLRETKAFARQFEEHLAQRRILGSNRAHEDERRRVVRSVAQGGRDRAGTNRSPEPGLMWPSRDPRTMGL